MLHFSMNEQDKQDEKNMKDPLYAAAIKAWDEFFKLTLKSDEQ